MDFKLGDKVRGEAWGQPFKGVVHAKVGAGRGLEMIVIHGTPIRTPMFTQDGDITSGTTPTYSIIVREDNGRSISENDWVEHQKEASA